MQLSKLILAVGIFAGVGVQGSHAESWDWSGLRTITNVQLDSDGDIRFWLDHTSPNTGVLISGCGENSMAIVDYSQTYHLQVAAVMAAYANNTPINVQYDADSPCVDVAVERIQY